MARRTDSASNDAPTAATPNPDLTVAVLGVGTMGEAILCGSLAGGVDPAKVTVTARRESRVAEVTERYGVRGLAGAADEPGAAPANARAVDGADLVLIGVEPDVVETVLGEIGTALALGAVVVSVAGGVATDALQAALPRGTAVVRAMPNTAAALRRGLVALTPGSACPEDALGRARAFFALSGEVIEVPERLQSAVGAVSGSGPAHLFYVADAMAEAAVALGISRELARRLVAQTVLGAGTMLAESGEHPVVLREQVSSPGGTTVQALADLDDRAVRAAFVAAITGRHRS